MKKGDRLFQVLKESKYSMTFIARRLKISRNTLYKRCRQENLPGEFLLAIEDAFDWDLSNVFPETQFLRYCKKMEEVRYLDQACMQVFEETLLLMTMILQASFLAPDDDIKKEIFDFVEEKIRKQKSIFAQTFAKNKSFEKRGKR